MKIEKCLNDSIFINSLSPACKMCAKGSKLVLLVTGLCPSNCFYCPLSSEKTSKDVIYADEWKLNNENDTEKIILEAEYIDAKGAGITGGDPLFVWKRTKKYITMLKENFGEDFHIHLYTSGIKNSQYINDLFSAGLDEIRFHPKANDWLNMEKSRISDIIKDTVALDIDVAIEIPIIPNMQNDIISLIKWSDEQGIDWINLNELEFSETNAENLKKEGFNVKDDISAAVKGSQESAYNIIDNLSNKDIKIGIHYCSSSFKDGIQLKNRLKRRAKNISKKFDIITKDGTLLKGVIYKKDKNLGKVYDILIKKFEIKKDYITINKEKDRIEIALWILQRIANELKKLNIDSYMIEEYPTADGLEVEKMPLPIR